MESAVGAHLANAAASGACRVWYWREVNKEVDFVVQAGRRLVSIEVKSGRSRGVHAGSAAFASRFKIHRSLLVGADGIALEEFLVRGIEHWVGV